MKTYQAYKTIEGILDHTEKKSEIKFIESLLHTIGRLSEHDLSEDQLHSVEAALDRILFRDNPETDFKKLKRNRNRFMTFLREEISLVPAGYYTALGVALGLSFGVAAGSVLQSVFGESSSIGIGIAIGMALGAAFGMFKDNEAARQDRVLQTRPLA